MSTVRPQSARLQGLAEVRAATSRPKTPMRFGGPDKTCPELVRINPPPIWAPKSGELPWKCESIPPPEQLRIHVTGQYGQAYVVKVYPEETIAAVKKQIKDQGGVMPAKQRLYVLGQHQTALVETDVVGNFENVEELGFTLFEELVEVKFN